MRKQELLIHIDRLPEQFDPEPLMHELYVKAKLDRAEEAVQSGRVISQEEAVRRSQEWFK